MKKKTHLGTALLAFLLLSGCVKNPDIVEDNMQSSSETQSSSQASDDSVSQTALDTSEMFTERDYETSYDKNASTVITLNGNSADCSSDTVAISGPTVTISSEGTYILSGTLNNGMIIVNAKNTDKIQLVLDGVTINSDTSAAVYIAQAEKVFLTQAQGSKNSLSNGGKFTAIDDNNIDAAIFSKDDLTINGEGTLTIASPAGHGVVSKDDLVVTSGEYKITSASQGLCGKESIRIADGTFSITAGKDGIHSEDADDTSSGFVYLANGVYDITADGDGISASNVMQIDDGSFTIKSGGGSETVTLDSNGNWDWQRPGKMPDETQETGTAGESVSAKGIKAAGNLLLNGGNFIIDSADDTLHSNANLMVNGGTWKLSTGDDGLHADETATVTNGNITITKSYEGIEGQNITISGGIIDLVASDDGLNAAGGNDQSGNGGVDKFQKGGFDAASDNTIIISGGTIHINASGDGVDSNGNLSITGGKTYVSGPSDNGNGALDYNGEASISNGIFVAAGSSGMAQNFGTSSTQGAMMVNISGSENDTVTLKDSSGKELLGWTADKAFSCVVISCPKIKQGESYTVAVGDTSQNITMDSLIYGSGGGMGKGSGGRGRGSGGRSGKPKDYNNGGDKPPVNNGNPDAPDTENYNNDKII